MIRIALLLSASAAAVAGDAPPYMQITVGQSAEIKGSWQDGGFLLAEEVELLPEERRPKLRGVIAAVDTAAHAIKIFGQWVDITRSTQFLDAPGGPVDFSLLKPKVRAEVSCKVDSTGRWSARHIRVQKVKGSDKVKGTITRVAFDGRSPDTLAISGLRVIVTDKTEVFRTLGGTTETDIDPEPSADSVGTRRP